MIIQALMGGAHIVAMEDEARLGLKRWKSDGMVLRYAVAMEDEARLGLKLGEER